MYERWGDKSMIKVLALSLEGTLISNSISQIARDGLHSFLSKVYLSFPRVVMYTTVSEPEFRKIAKILVSNKDAPEWFESIEYVKWQGSTKDLRNVPFASVNQIYLMDDSPDFINKNQHDQWVKIKSFKSPYDKIDTELNKVFTILAKK
jgi:hypothetical protein